MLLSEKFERYAPTEPKYGNVSYCRNINGDWYEQQKGFEETTLKIIYDDSGRISAFSKDVSSLPDPTGMYVAEIRAESVDIDTYRYIAGQLVEHKKSAEELAAENEMKKQSLIAEATRVLAPLQDAVELGIATEAETTSYNAWRTYRVMLMRVNPSMPAWPSKP